MFEKSIVFGLAGALAAALALPADHVVAGQRTGAHAPQRIRDNVAEGTSGGFHDFGAVYWQIQIESNPTGASLFLNGQPWGSTPRTINSKLSTLRMVLRKPGYLETAAEITLTEPVTVIHANLKSMP